MALGRPKRDGSAGSQAAPANSNGNGANLGFEAQMFLAADKLRKNLEPSDYKHVALGLIFLKHISNALEAKHAALLAGDAAAAETGASSDQGGAKVQRQQQPNARHRQIVLCQSH
jgi:type I restriction enzyme M protein